MATTARTASTICRLIRLIRARSLSTRPIRARAAGTFRSSRSSARRARATLPADPSRSTETAGPAIPAGGRNSWDRATDSTRRLLRPGHRLPVRTSSAGPTPASTSTRSPADSRTITIWIRTSTTCSERASPTAVSVCRSATPTGSMSSSSGIRESVSARTWPAR